MKLGMTSFGNSMMAVRSGSPTCKRARAEQKIALLRRSNPGRYFLRNAETGAVIGDSTFVRHAEG